MTFSGNSPAWEGKSSGALPVDGLLLAGDIGATKTVLALYANFPGPPLRQAVFRNRDFPAFAQLLGRFIGDQLPEAPVWACFGVAGPVLDDTVRMTNLDWVLAVQALQDGHGLRRVWLINDLVATAMGAIHLPASDLHVLNPGRAKPGAVTAVLAPGSGLGEAFVVTHDGAHLPLPSEGGHASFAPRDTEQMELWAFLRERQEHVSVEQVCSGLAIPTLFAFQADRCAPPNWLRAELDAGADPTPAIVRAGVAAIQGGRSCETAVRTLRLLVDILADEAANLALKTLAIGGLFVGGGLAPRLLPFLTPERFMAVFARGKYRNWLQDLPLRVILNPETALLGAAAYGVSRLGR